MGRKEEINQRIHEAAIEEFINKGLNSASMENISKLADVSKRTLYKYYANKDAIFDSIITKLLESFCHYSEITYSPVEEIEIQIDRIIDAKLELITSDEYIKISKLVLSELLKGKALSEEHLIQFNQTEQKFISWIDAAKKNGKIRSSQASDLIANQFHSVIKGQTFYPVMFGIHEVSEAHIENAKITAKSFFIKSFCS